jgi:hypothetical protein
VLGTGPFKVTPVHCGRCSAAQQLESGTNARGGLIYRYTNDSNSVQGAAIADVTFTGGSTVEGENVAGKPPSTGPGQSAEGEIDAVNSGGSDLRFTGCKILSDSVQTADGDQPGSTLPQGETWQRRRYALT